MSGGNEANLACCSFFHEDGARMVLVSASGIDSEASEWVVSALSSEVATSGADSVTSFS